MGCLSMAMQNVVGFGFTPAWGLERRGLYNESFLFSPTLLLLFFVQISETCAEDLGLGQIRPQEHDRSFVNACLKLFAWNMQAFLQGTDHVRVSFHVCSADYNIVPSRSPSAHEQPIKKYRQSLTERRILL